MFYDEKPEQRLRFGDIIKGYIGITPVINVLDVDVRNCDFNIEVSYPEFFVVLTPCCSIEKKTLIIAPLERVLGSFFLNPYFVKDLTGINKKMTAEQSVSPNIFKSWSSEEREKRVSEEPHFALTEFFVYEKHDLLPEYEINMKDVENIKTKYYMVNFKKTFNIKCDLINKNGDFALKVLQLSLGSRNDLRDKIGSFYSSRPIEDIVEEAVK